jgi:predicted transcriptional regulator
MKLDNIVIPTGLARAGMTVGAAFRECLQHQVSCIPVAGEDNRIVGRFSIHETLRMACIPSVAIYYADMLSDNLGGITMPEDHACQIASQLIDRFISTDFATIHSVSPVIKAIILMEKHATDTVFVIDNGEYRGVVTIEAIARRMLEVSDA